MQQFFTVHLGLNKKLKNPFLHCEKLESPLPNAGLQLGGQAGCD